MPRQHTQFFKDLSSKVDNEYRLKADDVSAQLKAGALNYEEMSDLLRETNDAQFGIVSTLQGITWIRDATAAIPLTERMSRDAPVIAANNALLRCLSRLRPIDFAVGKKLGDEGDFLRKEMQNRFGDLTQHILTIAQGAGSDTEKQEAIKQKEKEFNTVLIEHLHKANLTTGCDNEEQAQKLLFHYRNLSSVLAPARTIVTLTYDKVAHILQRETQYPVTKKTDAQQQEIEKLKVITAHPTKQEKNSHNAQRVAAQEADRLFADLLAHDDRALGAQARKTHLVGAKNAFVVKNELMEIEDEVLLDDPEQLDALRANPGDMLWLARMGSPAFVGKGETKDVVQTHTEANLEQVRQTAAQVMGRDKPDSLHIHVTTLNTDSPLEHQHTIIKNVYQATRDAGKGDNVSYVPTNPDGTFRLLDIAQGLDFGEGAQPRGSAPLQKATRLESVSKVVLAASNTADTLSLVHCASGQDRTGTAIERATQDWMKKNYAQKGLISDNIEYMRAEGGNAAEITTHHIHGSPGMKTDSVANNFFGSQTTFSKRATQEMYLSSAKTNKENKVGDVSFLKIPSTLAIVDYEQSLSTFEEHLARKPPNPKQNILYEKGQVLLQQVKAIAGEDPKQLKSNELNQLTQVLNSANQSLLEANNVEKSKANVRELTHLSHEVSGKSSSKWKALGIGLLTFACAALVVVGILAAIPTGGASLLATVAGAVGLAATAGIGTGVATAGIAGTAALIHGKEKGLASAVSNFKDALSTMKIEENIIEEEHDQGLNEPLLGHTR